jgi:16S rRNA (cytosine1402-N4)-methyltransferase
MAYHTPVLLKEVVSQMQPRSGGLYVDATLGGGGHATELLRASSPDGRLIGLDWDAEALAEVERRLGDLRGRATLVRANFAELEDVLMDLGVTSVDGVLFDLGISSRHVDEASRGFSFQREGQLDMRMDARTEVSASDLLNAASEAQLAAIFLRYGEERRARAIARAVVRTRERQPLVTTTDLVRVVEQVLGPKRGPTHPATRVFQALRIYINRELENLERGLETAVRRLKSGGRVVVIAYHSLEDRIVKHYFQRLSSACICPPGLPVCACGRQDELRVITKRPVGPSPEELAANPRSRSAKMRVAEKR